MIIRRIFEFFKRGCKPTPLTEKEYVVDIENVIDNLYIEKEFFSGVPCITYDNPHELELNPYTNFKWIEAEKEETVVEEEMDLDEYTYVNHWQSSKLCCVVYIYRNKEGKSIKALSPPRYFEALSIQLSTINACAHALNYKAELKAQEKLKTHISEYDFASYILTGCFMEISKKSQYTSMFRKGKPTIAFRENGEIMRNSVALCHHVMGGFSETWAGVMVPTDDVIAHLLRMRVDEHGFWKKSNHHKLDSPFSGV